MTQSQTLAPVLTPALTFVFALATGALVANQYYAQPLIALIAPALGLSPRLAGLLTTVPQLGYGVGLFLLVSLADLVENRKLVLFTVAGAIAGLIATGCAANAATFFIAAFVTGVCSTGAQILLPFAAHLVPPAQRGRVIGNVMSGLLTGIMLARPLASFMAAAFGWRAIFFLSAGLMVVVGVLLAQMMPRHQPRPGMHYGQIIASMLKLARSERVLQRRSLYQALMFCAFNLFWTAAPLMLARSFGFGQTGIAIFALAGAGGALAAPIAGRLADRGHEGAATAAAAVLLAASFFLTRWTVAAHDLLPTIVLAIALDAAVQLNQIAGQRQVYAISAEARGRVNAAYMTIVFLIGALGSGIGAALYESGGWSLAAMAGMGFGLVMLALFSTEKIRV